MQVKSLDNAIKNPHNLGKVPHVTELWSQERNVEGREGIIFTVLMLI